MIKPWLLAARPQTLPAGLGPVMIGLSLSSQVVPLDSLLATLTILTTLLLQVSSNFINDYYDGVTGADSQERLGPTRMVSTGQIKPSHMKNGFLITLSLSFILGLFLMTKGGLPIIIIGLSSLFFAWAYTGGPYPLSYFALGEVFALIFFGPVAVWGTYFIQTKSYDYLPSILLWGCAVGLISSAIMGINNLRDLYQDRKVNKVTIATLIGESPMRLLILGFLIVSCLITGTLIDKSLFYCFIPFVFFTFNWRSLMHKSGFELNNVLANTGRYLFIFSLYFSYLILGQF